MTPFDPPAAAARRQYALDRIVEDLVAWGCPLTDAEPRARQVLDHVLDAGYALPAPITDTAPPPAGPSTPAGRTRARVLFTHHRVADELATVEGADLARRARCACRTWHGPWRPLPDEVEPDHAAHLAHQITETERAAADRSTRAAALGGPGATNRGRSVPEDPPNGTEPHRGTEGVGS